MMVYTNNKNLSYWHRFLKSLGEKERFLPWSQTSFRTTGKQARRSGHTQVLQNITCTWNPNDLLFWLEGTIFFKVSSTNGLNIGGPKIFEENNVHHVSATWQVLKWGGFLCTTTPSLYFCWVRFHCRLVFQARWGPYDCYTWSEIIPIHARKYMGNYKES